MEEVATISVQVNGQRITRTVPVRMSLADFLRQELELTGTHVGCEQGICGACTVVVNGRCSRSCLMLAVQVDGGTVETVEGATETGRLKPLQDAFYARAALQCGFCTPGIVVSAKALLDRNPRPTEEEIRHAIAGNLCRCTGYDKIVAAIAAAAAEMAEGVEK